MNIVKTAKKDEWTITASSSDLRWLRDAVNVARFLTVDRQRASVPTWRSTYDRAVTGLDAWLACIHRSGIT